MVEGNAGRTGDALRRFCGLVLHAGAHFQHFLNAGGRGRAAGEVDDEVGKRHQRDEDLRQIVDQRDHVALPHLAGADALAAEPDDQHHGQIDDDHRRRVEGRGDASGEHLQAHEGIGGILEATRLFLLAGKGADDARAGKILAREQRKAIHARLYALVKAQRAGDDQIDDKADERRGDEEDERQFHADGQRHDDGAKHHERRAQQQAQDQIDPRLRLIDIRGQAGDESAGADAVQFRVRKRVDVLEQRRAHRRAEAHRRLGGEELGRDRADEAQHAEQHHDQRRAPHRRRVAIGDGIVDDVGHQKRHDQFKARLQQLEQRADDAFEFIILQIDQQFFHRSLPCVWFVLSV